VRIPADITRKQHYKVLKVSEMFAWNPVCPKEVKSLKKEKSELKFQKKGKKLKF